MVLHHADRRRVIDALPKLWMLDGVIITGILRHIESSYGTEMSLSLSV